MYRVTLPAIRQGYVSATSHGITKAPTFKGEQNDTGNQTGSGSSSDQFQRTNSASEATTDRMATLKKKGYRAEESQRS